MATKKYYLNENKTDTLQCSWGMGWKDFKIEYNDQLVGDIIDRTTLRNGIELNLTPEKVLFARLKQGLTLELELLINGKPVKGSATDPEQQIKLAYGLSLFIGGLNILLSLLGMIANIAFLNQLGMGMGSIIFGLFILALAFGIKRQISWAAFAVAGLLVADIILSMIFTINSGGNPSTAGIVLRIFFIIFIYKGGIAIRRIRS